jgi:hypothetical protein
MAITANIVLSSAAAKKIRKHLRSARDFASAAHKAAAYAADETGHVAVSATEAFTDRICDEVQAAYDLLKQAVRDSEE